MGEEQAGTTPKAMWMLVVFAPVIVAIEMQLNFVLVRQACSAQRNVALYAIIGIGIILTVAAAIFAFRIWRRAGAAPPAEGGDLASRIRFIAVLGILSSVMSFLVVFAQGIATVQFDPCQF